MENKRDEREKFIHEECTSKTYGAINGATCGGEHGINPPKKEVNSRTANAAWLEFLFYLYSCCYFLFFSQNSSYFLQMNNNIL